jgi:mannose-6-phosphate isomerase-like protein (cupin superfamily)
MESEIKNPVIHEIVTPGFERDIIYLDDLMVAVCTFTNGPADKPDMPHSHPHEQITYVAEGNLKFFMGEEEKYLSKGDLIAVKPGIQHCIQILSKKVRLIDSFSPVREDFLK